MKKKNFESEEKPISFKDLVEVRKDEMQSMLPNLFTRVGDVVVKSREINIGGKKR